MILVLSFYHLFPRHGDAARTPRGGPQTLTSSEPRHPARLDPAREPGPRGSRRARPGPCPSAPPPAPPRPGPPWREGTFEREGEDPERARVSGKDPV